MDNLAILGSTGSIGTQTLDVVRSHPDHFSVGVLTAGSNWELLARQAREFRPRLVVIADKNKYTNLREALSDIPVEIAAGDEEIERAAAEENVSTVVTAMVGYSGLKPTISAIKAGKRIALSNKETLVVGGELIEKFLKQNPDSLILPVDSEHSAIFQCLQGENPASVASLILTASGGPFRSLSPEDLKNVTVEQTLAHPNWSMGPKVTVDSATMMNKGFEMIEARWLFSIPPERIRILVHPQSVVHSMVEFIDGSVKAQLGIPDMRHPIQYALGYPERLPSCLTPLDLTAYTGLTFENPDLNKFPALELAYKVMKQGGCAPCVLNAANEVTVAAFLKHRIHFTDISRINARVLDMLPGNEHVDLDNLMHYHTESTRIALSLL